MPPGSPVARKESSMLAALLPALLLFLGDDPDQRPGFHTRFVTHDAQKRGYLYHVPKNYDPKTPTPLVLVLHGATMNGAAMAWFTGMNETGDKHNFISVYPSGTGIGLML